MGAVGGVSNGTRCCRIFPRWPAALKLSSHNQPAFNKHKSNMRTAQDLLTELNASDESTRIEAKRAREMGKSIL